jgi:hypothetical protein
VLIQQSVRASMRLGDLLAGSMHIGVASYRPRATLEPRVFRSHCAPFISVPIGPAILAADGTASQPHQA